MTSPTAATPAAHDPSLLTIADVEQDTGLSKDTLRVWERRYGFPTPVRDALGERRYSQAQLLRLRLIKRLLDHGHRPGRVVPLALPELQALPTQRAPRQPGRRTALDCPTPAPMALAPHWLNWLARNEGERLRAELLAHLAQHGLADTVVHLLAPLTVAVGEAWQEGRLTVFQEHLYSETVQNVLRGALLALPPLPNAPRVLLTTLPKEQHHLGLLMAECFMALEGCTRLTLGPCTPLSDIVQAAQALRADVVGLSFSAHSKPQDTRQSLLQLREKLPASTELWVGGGAPVLYGRLLPKGIQALSHVQLLGAEIARWKKNHPDGAHPGNQAPASR